MNYRHSRKLTCDTHLDAIITTRGISQIYQEEKFLSSISTLCFANFLFNFAEARHLSEYEAA